MWTSCSLNSLSTNSEETSITKNESENMYELVISFDALHKNAIIQLLGNKYQIVEDSITIIDGEYSSYIHLQVNKKEGDTLLEALNKNENIDGVYLKPKGTPPSH